LTLAEAQREELRDALKIFVIWLSLKGCEPLFDYTLGYVVPFYTLAKAFVLLVLALFRVQLFKHAFDSFVVPLGRPNTPLINATAFTELILPTLRFLLSLPFAHLSMAIKNAVIPYLASWSDSQLPEAPASFPTTEQLVNSQRVAPPVPSDARKVSSTLSVRRNDHPRGPGSGSASLTNRRSVESLQSRPRHPSSSITDVRARSISSRPAVAPLNQHTINTLADMPSVPKVVPSGSISSSSAHLPPTFANIPAYVRKDIVAPPSQRPASYLPSMSSPRMPGSLSGSPESGTRLAPAPFSSPTLSSVRNAATSSASLHDDSQTKDSLPTQSSIGMTTSTDVEMTPKRSQKGRQSVKGTTPRAKRKASEKVDGDDDQESIKALASPPKQRKRNETDTITDEDGKSSAKSRLPVSQSRRNARTKKDESAIKPNETGTKRRVGETSSTRTGTRARKMASTQ
jgi:hypothetical protein